MANPLKDCSWRNATLEDVEAMHRIENICFPPEEAADLEGVRYRIANASKYFSILEKGKEICGFINGTCVADVVIHHDSMSTHDPTGSTLVIHSVSIIPSRRRQGLGQAFLKQYMDNIINNNDYTNISRVLLLTHAYLIPFYSECGFTEVGVSAVEHGPEKWYEMAMDVAAKRI